MNDKDMESLLYRHLRGELGERESHKLKELLANNSSAKKMLEQLRNLDAALDGWQAPVYSFHQDSQWEEMKTRLHASKPGPMVRLLPWLATAAAVCFIAWFGVSSQSKTGKETSDTGAAREANLELTDLRFVAIQRDSETGRDQVLLQVQKGKDLSDVSLAQGQEIRKGWRVSNVTPQYVTFENKSRKKVHLYKIHRNNQNGLFQPGPANKDRSY